MRIAGSSSHIYTNWGTVAGKCPFRESQRRSVGRYDIDHNRGGIAQCRILHFANLVYKRIRMLRSNSRIRRVTDGSVRINDSSSVIRAGYNTGYMNTIATWAMVVIKNRNNNRSFIVGRIVIINSNRWHIDVGWGGINRYDNKSRSA